MLEAGLVAVDEQDNVIQSIRFDPDSLVESYRAVKDGAASGKAAEIAEGIKSKGYLSCMTNEDALASILTERGIDASLMSSEEQLALQGKKVGIMLGANFAPSEFEALHLLRKFAVDLSSARVAEVSARRDLHTIQSVNAMDEIDRIVNIAGARVREWYGLHFPELDGILQSLTAYCDIVSRGGERENLDRALMEKIGLQEKGEAILDAASSSKGGVITAENLQALQRLAEETRQLSAMRDSLTKHLEDEMDTVAPNVKEILGATIGARLIARTGGLDRLAMLPASTIQVIGAEKALFRALKSGTRPPKHGIIFQLALVHSAPKWQRGKIARAVAAKVAVGARIDAYKGSKEPSLMAKLNERVEEIRRKYKEPVEREERPDRFMQRRRDEGPRMMRKRIGEERGRGKERRHGDRERGGGGRWGKKKWKRRGRRR
ncbi:MAG: NOP5/NOP56 family protein [Nitrososphaerales archaeon]